MGFNRDVTARKAINVKLKSFLIHSNHELYICYV